MDTISKQYQQDEQDQQSQQDQQGQQDHSKLYQDGYEGGGAPWES
ncbi:MULTISPECIES: hypothetical protein [Streptomyces]|nr:MULTISPECIES: hypothetical protein [Streptomyces]